jgi:hypothetical protein
MRLRALLPGSKLGTGMQGFIEMSFGRRQPAGFSGMERRGHVRHKTDATGLILVPTLERMTGRVTDFSRSGARLEVASAFGLPVSFALRVQGQTYRARIVRRGSGHVGLRFFWRWACRSSIGGMQRG